jgi:cobalt-zinc-cadmium efflux system membrane fusion protein
VSGRVKAGDEVVTEGSFLLKTETLKESIGAGCCVVE